MCSAENTQKISVLSPQYPYESKTALKTAIEIITILISFFSTPIFSSV